MNIFKKRISLILSVVMLATAILPIFVVNAASTVNYELTLDGKAISFGSTYEVVGGEKVEFEASATEGGRITTMSYQIGSDGTTNPSAGSKVTITIPTGTVGSTKTIYLNAGGKDVDGNVIQLGWKNFKVKYVEQEDNTTPQVSMTIKMGSKTLGEGSKIEVEGGEKITVSAKSTKAAIERIGYYFYANGKKEGSTTDIYEDNITITVPTGTAGMKRYLYIEAVAENDNGQPNTITKTGWVEITLNYKEEEPEEPVTPSKKDITVAHAGKTLVVNSTTEANPGESLKITATPTDEVVKLYFRWDSDNWSTVANTGSYSMRVPDYFKPGTTHTLYVKAQYADGTTVAEEKYIFRIPEKASDITMNVKLDSKTLTTGKTYEVKGGEEVVVTASVTGSDVDYIRYYFGSDSAEKVNKSKATFEVPDKKAGTTLKLYVEAVAEDGSTTGVKTYTLKFVDVIEGELDIEPWMEENDEITELSINLRNDSEEEEKANKNIYALEEVVTYFIDYKNGTGDDITSTVKIEFEIPLDYEIVDADEGIVDEDERIITWEFEDGLEEDEAGTLVVKLKYTDFTKSKFDNETIYPSAAIFKGKKEMDRSTVINLIVEEYDMEIDEVHKPYMHGDEETPTFRPDDPISRAEGALVLSRIYGLNYKSTQVTDTFSDLDETYLEAQKAIVAASKAGLINGYTNGTFKPNASMTRAEFIKILACMIEKNAEDEEIEGLEVKDVENNIKVYADSTRYYIVDGKKIYSHWALEEITLLARLNMLPVTEDEPELELDEEITRAEVAQLVNLYLLRAPASVTSKTKSGFDDVSKKHDLFADIIEATRDEHTFSMNEDDGTENAE
ncbi:MAG: S-layer homology domain-containing protein [Clostridia bacterium]|nr:S-layer homology domain-containing protein [Clostridia bacterium]